MKASAASILAALAGTVLALAVLAWLVTEIPGFYAASATWPEAVKAPLDWYMDAKKDRRRIADLRAVRDALERYRAGHGGYPISAQFDGLATSFGMASREWIKGLVPDYLPRLPRDPDYTFDPQRQYLYYSNGRDYKLIAHGAVDCRQVLARFPELVDTPQTCDSYGFWTEGAAGVHPAYFNPDNHVKRIKDLAAMGTALAAYHAKYGRYPAVDGFAGRVSAWGYSGPDWIPGLVPEFLPGLPRDPRGNDSPANQYLYASNGADYKLIAHHPEDCPLVKSLDAHLIDPKRDCLAYGIWTPGAADW